MQHIHVQVCQETKWAKTFQQSNELNEWANDGYQRNERNEHFDSLN